MRRFINARSIIVNMGILNRLFASNEASANEIKLDDRIIAVHWQNYVETIPQKELVISKLPFAFGERQKPQQRLKELLNLELADVRDVENKKDEIVRDLKSLEHSKQIKRVHRLEQSLSYVETKYEYVHALLEHLFKILRAEAALAEKLNVPDLSKYKAIVQLIKNQLELEKEVISKINGIQTFHNLFIALAKGEHLVKTMDKGEKRMLRLMDKRMKAIFGNKIKEKITYRWAMSVFNAIEDKVHEAVEKNMLEYHPDVDFEFANRHEFVDLVREEIKKLRQREVSEKMIAVFVNSFREWYNHQRD